MSEMKSLLYRKEAKIETQWPQISKFFGENPRILLQTEWCFSGSEADFMEVS